MSNGASYVRLAPAGQLGVGSVLAQKVQTGTIQAAQHSISNFAPFAPVVDVTNIPYWCGGNQTFVNLVTSEAWKKEVNPKVEAKGFKPLRSEERRVGKSVSVRVDLGGRRIIKKKK